MPNDLKSKQAQDRDARLAEALRQNLRRRKTQAKAQATERVAEEEPPEDGKD